MALPRKTNTLYNILDQYTKESVTYDKVTLYKDGSAMDDSKTDGVIYRKYGTEYFKRNIDSSINVKWFGAKCDFNPSTLAGTDDTNAWTLAIAAAGADYSITWNGISKITSQVALKPYTSIKGTGFSSIIWADLTDTNESLFVLSNTVDPYNGELKNFAIYGGDTCGFAALFVNANSFLDYANINITVCGGFEWVYYQSVPDAFGTLTGGIQNSDIRINIKLPQWRWAYGYDMMAYPVNGFYNKGYVNATDMWFDFQGLVKRGGLGGDGIVLIANYSAAGSSTLRFTVQGAEGKALIIDGLKGGLAIENFYNEANAEDVEISNSKNIECTGRGFGNVNVINSFQIRISNCDRLTTDDISEVHVGKTAYDGESIVSNSDGVTTDSYPQNNAVSAQYSRTVKSKHDYRNCIENGDFLRFCGTTAWSSQTPWGFNDTGCVALQTGVGLSDTTHSAEGYAVKITERPLFDYTLKKTLSLGLIGRLGGVMNVSFKYKGTGGYVAFTDGSDNSINLQNSLTGGVAVENSFKLVRYNIRITQLMVDNGFTIKWHIPTGSIYVSEVYAGFGVGAPHGFTPYSSNNFKLVGSTLLVSGTTSQPTSDPIFNQPWVAGDQFLLKNPSATGIHKYICITGGSPGVWRALGSEILNQTTAQTGNFNITGKGTVGSLEAVSDGAGLSILVAPGTAIRNGTVGSVQYLDLGDIIVRDGNGSSGAGSVSAVTYKYSTLPQDCIDDTAAAAAGVGVGGTYRTGNILKVRII